MSECVVRMEMPENCQRCELFEICTGKYKNEVIRFDGKNIDKKDRRCLFICQLPEGHGRLVDADYYAKTHAGGEMLKFAETIVPAERSET